MTIMIAARVASSTEGANHDIMKSNQKISVKSGGETGKWDRNYIWNVIRESAEI